MHRESVAKTIHYHDLGAMVPQAQRREARQLTEIYASREFLEPELLALLGTADQEAHLQQPATQATKTWLAMAGLVTRNSVRRINRKFALAKMPDDTPISFA
jgi:DNA-binding GntR family transcriptional regulator